MHNNVLRETTYSSFISSSLCPECESQKEKKIAYILFYIYTRISHWTLTDELQYVL